MIMKIDINITIGIAQGDGSEAYKYTKRIISYARKNVSKDYDL